MMFIFFRGLLQKPGHKAKVRLSQVRAAAQAKNFPPLKKPHYQTLLDEKIKFKEFVDGKPEFKALLKRPLGEIVVVCVCVCVCECLCGCMRVIVLPIRPVWMFNLCDLRAQQTSVLVASM